MSVGVILTDPWSDRTKPSRPWRALEEWLRIICVTRHLAMRSDGVRLVAIENLTRVVVMLPDSVAPKDRPAVLRELEHRLKREVEPSLQVYLNPRRDDSLLRLRVSAKRKDGEV